MNDFPHYKNFEIKKDDLWNQYLKDFDLKYTDSQALKPKITMLMVIAKDKRLSNTNYGSFLPPSWRTLYELTKLKVSESKNVSGLFISPNYFLEFLQDTF